MEQGERKRTRRPTTPAPTPLAPPDEQSALLDLLPIGVCVLRTDVPSPVRHNRAMRELFGLDPACDDARLTELRFLRGERLLGPEENPLVRAVAAGVEIEEELEALRPDGGRLSVVAHAKPLRAPDGETRGGVITFVDVTEARRREREQRFLSEASALLAGEADVDAVLSRLAELSARLLADVCTVYDLDEAGQVRLRAMAAADDGGAVQARDARGPVLAEPSQLHDVLRTGEARLVRALDPRAPLPGLPPEMFSPSEVPPASALLVPVVGRGHVFAALAFVSRRRPLGEADLHVAEDLAKRAGLALANASLVEAEQRSRAHAERAAERLGRVQRLMASLSNELSRDRIFELIIDEGSRALDAQSGALWLLDPDARSLARVRTFRQADRDGGRRAQRPSASLPVDDSTPLGRALLRRGPLWLDGLEALRARFPSVSAQGLGLERDGVQGMVCLPLLSKGRPLGALAFGFDEARRFDEEERRFLAVLAQSCADALERARLFEAERRACARAEGVAMRLAHLNAVMAELARATTVEAIGDVFVEDGVAACGAESGAFFVEASDGAHVRRVRARGDAMLRGELPERFPLDLESPLTTAVREGRAVWIASQAEMEARFPGTRRRLRRSRAQDVDRLACAPLLVDGVPRGAIALGFGFGEGFDADERLFVELLMKTCSHALERALLLEDERRAKAALEDANERLEVVIRASPAAIMLLELDGTVRMWNPTAERTFGWSAAEVIGSPLPTVPQDRQAELQDVLARVGRGEQVLGLETRRVARAGAHIDISLWAAPVRTSEGVQCLSVVADITEKKRAEEVRREAEARFRRLFESNIVGIGVWHADGRVQDANDGLLRMLGYERDALEAGHVTWRSFTLPGEEQRDFRAIEEMHQRGVCAPYEKTYVRKDGSRLPALVGAATWEGAQDAGVFLAIDISAQKRAEERQRFLAEAGRILTGSLDYEVTLKQVVDLVVPGFADWCFVHLHDAASDTLERVAMACADATREGALGAWSTRIPNDGEYAASRAVSSARPELRRGLDEAGWRAVAHTDEHLAKLRLIAPRSFLAAPLVVRGAPIGALTLSSSTRDYAQSDLELAEELASRASLAIDNARLYRDARAAIQAREDFLSVASHELKTPLNSLQLHVQMLLRAFEREPEGPSHEMLTRSLAAVQRQVERQTKLINDLLDVSRVSLGSLSLAPERVALDELVREVVARFDAELERTSTRLRVDTEPVVGTWDRSRLDQVVTNLLSNAVKYGRGAPVELRVERRGPWARLLVRDRGIGIAPEHKSRIFDRFERAVSERHYGGFGLGLWITRQIVEASGGRITVESAPDAGSTFTVDLPLVGAGG